jgi:hypothetical protein
MRMTAVGAGPKSQAKMGQFEADAIQTEPVFNHFIGHALMFEYQGKVLRRSVGSAADLKCPRLISFWSRTTMITSFRPST